MRKTTSVEKCCYSQYYLAQAHNQTGNGGGPVYIGRAYQRGHGIGSILARFGRYIAPILYNGAKFVGKKLLGTGTRVFSDVMAGQNLKEAVKRRGTETLDEVRKQYGSGKPAKKRKTTKKKFKTKA